MILIFLQEGSEKDIQPNDENNTLALVDVTLEDLKRPSTLTS